MEITVAGVGHASIPPELATLLLTLGFEGDDKAGVLASTTELVHRMSEEIARLREGTSPPVTWVAVLPIATRSWRPWSESGEVLPMRFAAQARVRLTFRDVTVLAAFADTWGGRSGVTLGHVEWTLTEELREDTEAAVLRRAVEQARARAQVLAEAAGAGAVRCVRLADPGLLGDGPEPLPERVAAMALRAAGDGPGGEGIDIVPEDVVIEARIHAHFVSET